MRPWPAVFGRDYTPAIDGKHTAGKTHRQQIDAVKQDLTRFRDENQLDQVILVNLASTETWLEVGAVHESLKAFEKGLDDDAPEITPLMRYIYAANDLGMPHANFTPSLANVPALKEQAMERGVPFAGMDGKTGQTLVKTALGPMFRVRRLHVEGWYSINFLGNNDGLVLNEPGSNKTKVMSKSSVLDSVVGHKVENHQVHIHYYKPRGDAKEAWDNIDMRGFAGIPMQMKVNFLCQDSVLAAPLVVDLVRLLAVAQQAGERGIQTQLSVFFKSPYHEPNQEPIHDLFEQERMLLAWAHRIAPTQPTATRSDRIGVDRTRQRGSVERSL
jgi:myo-inositol-1-phosphate synthase